MDGRSNHPAGPEGGATSVVPWSRPTFTSDLRGPRAPSAGDREHRVVHEDSLALRVMAAVARVPGLRRVLGAPADLGSGAGDREVLLDSPLYRRIDLLRSTGLYDRVWRSGLRPLIRRGALAPAASDEAGVPTPADAPTQARLSPWIARQVDDALSILRSVPFEEIQRRGWHFQPNHFYWPLNDVAFLRDNPDLWHDRGLPRGIEWELDAQLELARIVNGYAAELAEVPSEPERPPTRYAWDNGAFGGADAFVYYGLVRHLRPRHVVEVGSGWSSLLLARALERNATPTGVTLIEPYPDDALFASLPADWKVERSIVQRAGPEAFERLEPGDVCFYDGSHCVRTGGDVTWFFFEVLPRLAAGVWVHIHDIFFPDDYHDSWIFDEGLSWNEQYVLQAFLMHNDAYRVRLCNHMLYRLCPDEIAGLYACDGGSIWLEKIREG
jgi:predicted O-methyltransferase YrrM